MNPHIIPHHNGSAGLNYIKCSRGTSPFVFVIVTTGVNIADKEP